MASRNSSDLASRIQPAPPSWVSVSGAATSRETVWRGAWTAGWVVLENLAMVPPRKRWSPGDQVAERGFIRSEVPRCFATGALTEPAGDQGGERVGGSNLQRPSGALAAVPRLVATGRAWSLARSNRGRYVAL